MVAEPVSVGMDAGALAEVERIFNEQIRVGQHPGAGLAVYRHGRLVLDLLGGVADSARNDPVTAETLFVLFSSTKPLASLSVLQQIDRGKADLDDPVAKHWPAFAQNGKEHVTIRHILTHRGGFPETPPDLHWSQWRDWDAVVRAMEATTPRWEPGTVSAYHPLNHGWVCGELVRRIDGRDFPTYLRDEVTGPLGMTSTFVGLPADHESRVATLHPMEDVDEAGKGTVKTFNRPEVHRAVIPAGCGLSTARDMARFYAALSLGGELDGQRVIGQELLDRALSIEVDGDTDRSLGAPVRRGLGFNLGGLSGPNRMGRTSTPFTFGHGGAGTSICWGDRELGLAVAFLPNGFRGASTIMQRCEDLSDAIRAAVR